MLSSQHPLVPGNRNIQAIPRQPHISSPRWWLAAASVLLPVLILVIGLLTRLDTVQAKPAAPTITGFVLNPEGGLTLVSQPVYIRKNHADGTCCEWDGISTTTSVADGSFLFDFIPPEYIPGVFEIQAEADGTVYYRSVPIPLTVTDPVGIYDLGVLRLTYESFYGTVYNPDGFTPFQGGEVSVYDPTPVFHEIAWGENFMGAYQVGGVPAGDWLLQANPSDDSILWYSAVLPVTVFSGTQYIPGSGQLITLTLQEPNLTGTIILPTGQPITWTVGQASVDVVGVQHPEVNFSRLTTSLGQFGFLVPPDGTAYTLWAEPMGVLTTTYTRSIPERYFVSDLVDTGPVTLTYPSFTGLVFDPLGFPYLGCVDICLEALPTYEIAVWEHYCGDGSTPYHLGGIEAGDYLLHTVPESASGYFPSQPFPVYVPPGSQYIPGQTQTFGLTLGAAQLLVDIRYSDLIPAPGFVHLWDGMGTSQMVEVAAGSPATFGGLIVGQQYWLQAWPAGNDIPTLANSLPEPVIITGAPISISLVLQTANVVGQATLPTGDSLPLVYDQGEPTYPVDVKVRDAVGLALSYRGVSNTAGQFSFALPDGEYKLDVLPRGDLVITFTQALPIEFTLPVGAPPLILAESWLTYPRLKGYVESPFGGSTEGDVVVRSNLGYYGTQQTAPGIPFIFGGLPDGEYSAQGEPPEASPQIFGPSDVYIFTVTPGSQYQSNSTEEITLTLSIPSFIGRLVFPPDFLACPGCGVEDVYVQSHTVNWSYEMWTATDVDGNFSFFNVPVGMYYLDFFLPPELQGDWSAPFPPPSFTIDYPEDQKTGVFELLPYEYTKSVNGYVLYEGGGPVTDASVVAYHQGDGRIQTTVTDADGAYNLGLGSGMWRLQVEPSTPYPDWFFDPVWGRWIEFILPELITETYTVSFTVTPVIYHRVTGYVFLPPDIPPPAGLVEVWLCSDEGACYWSPVYADGSYLVNTLPGLYRVYVRVDPANGFYPPDLMGFPILVTGDMNLGTLLLRSEGECNAWVRGRVLDITTGQGVPEVEMIFWTASGSRFSTLTDAAGYYETNLFSGQWFGKPLLNADQERLYFLQPPQLRDGYLEPGASATETNFYIRPRDAQITGQVVNQENEIITDTWGIAFALACAEANCWLVKTDPILGGNFQLDVVGGFTYTVGVWLPFHQFFPSPSLPLHIAVSPGGIVPVLARLIEPGTHVHGGIVDEFGLPVEIDAAVYGQESNGLFWVDDFTWPGNPEYDMFVPTPVTNTMSWNIKMWVDPDSGYIADPAYLPYRVDIAPGDIDITQTLHVHTLDKIITGTVWISDFVGGRPASYVWVYARGVGAGNKSVYFESMTDAAGYFVIPVISGSYHVGAYLPPDLWNTYSPLLPARWVSQADNPIMLTYYPLDAYEISGNLTVSPSGALPLTATVHVFGTSDAGHLVVSAMLGGSYHLPTVPHSTWNVWAAYEDTENDIYFESPVVVVEVSGSNANGIDLELRQAAFYLPDTECWSFDSAQFRRLQLQPIGNLPAPVLEIPPGAMPVTGTVQVCSTPRRALPGGKSLIGFAYDLEARDSVGNLITDDFHKPVRLSFYLHSAAIPPGVDLSSLQVVFYSTTRQEWVPLDELYVAPGTLLATGKINHFTRIGVRVPHWSTEDDYPLYLPIIRK